jgi:four helix bundle protein
MVEHYKDLRIWQQSVALAKAIYPLADLLPDKERYGLRSQMARAVVSVASNIAEGSRRQTSKDLTHFLSMALGSLAELETQLIIAGEIGYLSPDASTDVMEKIDHLARGIVKLKQTLEKRA